MKEKNEKNTWGLVAKVILVIIGIAYLIWPMDLMPLVPIDDIIVLAGAFAPELIDLFKKVKAQKANQ